MCRVGIIGSGSDYRAFMHNLGVPVLDICYTYDPVSPWCCSHCLIADKANAALIVIMDNLFFLLLLLLQEGSFSHGDIKSILFQKVNVEPLYHTLYETFALVAELYDAGFGFQAALTRLWAIMAVDLADTQVRNVHMR